MMLCVGLHTLSATLPDVRPVLQTRDFTVVVEGGIAWMVIDMQGKSVNVMNQGFLQQWNQVQRRDPVFAPAWRAECAHVSVHITAWLSIRH